MRHRMKFSHCSRSAEKAERSMMREAPLLGLHSPLKPGINFAKRRPIVGMHALGVSARLPFAAVPMFFNEVRKHLGLLFLRRVRPKRNSIR
jgi:hypothetical protein